jgi:hypothetical protein
MTTSLWIRLNAFLARLGICAAVGCMAGSFVGLFFAGLLLALPRHSIALGVAAILGACLGIVGWILIVLVLHFVAHYLLVDVLLPALGTTLVVSVLTALIVNAVDIPALSIILGWLIGLAVGAALCRLCTAISAGPA